jgi:hypothetical protein
MIFLNLGSLKNDAPVYGAINGIFLSKTIGSIFFVVGVPTNPNRAKISSSSISALVFLRVFLGSYLSS